MKYLVTGLKPRVQQKFSLNQSFLKTNLKLDNKVFHNKDWTHTHTHKKNVYCQNVVINDNVMFLRIQEYNQYSILMWDFWITVDASVQQTVLQR